MLCHDGTTDWYVNSIYSDPVKLSEQETIGKLNKLSGVVEVSEVIGIYDLDVKMYSDAVENMKQTITQHIRTINTIRSTMTLIVIE